MPSLVQQKEQLVRDARAVVEKAKSGGRDLTAAELDDVNGKLAEIATLDGKIASAKASEDILDRLGAIDGEQHPTGRGPQYLDLSPAGIKRMADGIAGRMVGNVDGRKGVLPAGETFASIPTIPTSPITLGLVQNGFLSTLSTTKIPAGANARYLRQTTRTNNAAAVPVGQIKPVSQYGLTPQDVVLRVYAHLSEPVDRFMLEDANELATFLANELIYGVFQAVEADCINGASGGDTITGILATSGIRTVAFDTDILTTTRNALTEAQKLGYATSPVFVLNPDDLASVDLAKANTSGVYLLDGAPQQTPTPTLWGVPVVAAIGMPAKTGLLVDKPSLSLYTDRQGVRVDWGTPGDSWSKNEIVARCEGRFDLGVLMPVAAAKIATGATTP